MSTTPCPGAPRQPPVGLSAAASEKDSYYGHEHTAKLAARFITHLFACPDEPPASSPSHSQAKLPFFIAYTLYRTKFHSAVTFNALLLLQQLKMRFPSARGSSGHRLFISAFMVASKVMDENTYSDKSWCIVAQNMFKLREIERMEREMLWYLEFKIFVDDKNLSDFRKAVTEDFGEDKDWRTYPTYPWSLVSKRPRPKETSLERETNLLGLDNDNNARQASPHEDADGELDFPWHEEYSNVDSEAFLPKSMDVRMFSNARNFSIRDTAINNAGGDITIHHHHHHSHFHQEPQGVSDHQFQWRSLLSSPGSTVFHLVADTMKKLLPLGFSQASEINLSETAAEHVFKYPRLHGVRVVESKTTMCLPGSIIQKLSSIRYSFY